MRVTNSYFVNSMLYDLNRNMTKLAKIQEQASTTKRINRPSDDPMGLNDALRLRTGLEELEKYKANAEDAQSWLQETDSALDESGDVLARVRELVIKAANDSLDATDRDAIVKELNQLKEHMVQVSNTSYAGRYVFSGTMTQTPPFDDTGVYKGNTDSIQYELGAGLKLPINVTGDEAFGDVFSTLDTIINDVTNGNSDALSNADLTNLDNVINKQLMIRSDIGARVNRTDLIINRAEDLNTNMTGLLSNVEDADMAEVSLLLNLQVVSYQAALKVGAQIIPTSLLDYLR